MKMMKITNAEFGSNIVAAAKAGTLVQGRWHDTRHDGVKVACLLGSGHESIRCAKDCNANLMPLWMAELTVALFDGIAAADVATIGERYGSLVQRWDVLTHGAWDDILTNFLVRTIEDALDSARSVATGKDYWPAVEAACKQSQAATLTKDKAAARAAASAGSRAARAAALAAERAASAAESSASAAAMRLFAFLLDQIEASISGTNRIGMLQAIEEKAGL